MTTMSPVTRPFSNMNKSLNTFTVAKDDGRCEWSTLKSCNSKSKASKTKSGSYQKLNCRLTTKDTLAKIVIWYDVYNSK